MNFFDRLEQRAREVDSLLCVGIDPRGTDADAVRAECFRLIDATADYACAFKPNIAFFEALGPDGLRVLQEVIAHVPGSILVILDAKRGDIADTAEAYTKAAFDQLGAHAITLSPYLGGEALKPFLARSERGAFVLCKTSNPGADEFQGCVIQDAEPALSAAKGCRMQDAGCMLYEVVAAHAQEWNTNGNVGLVIGATDPQALARVRNAAPDLWFLVPGIGAQGGDLQASLVAGLRPDGLGLLINVSRAIANAGDPGAAAKKLRDEINRWRLEVGDWKLEVGSWKLEQRYPISNLQPPTSNLQPPTSISILAQDLITSQCVRFGQFKLKSGIMSPIYLDLRRLVTHPLILKRVAQAYAAKLRELNFDRIAGIPYAALPIATAIALEMNRPMIYPRREAKDYGTQAVIEGDYAAGETIVVIDDLATTGGSKIEAIQKLEEANLKVRDIVVLIDRGQGAGPMLAEAGYQLHAVATLPKLLDEWLRAGAISREQFDEVVEFLTR
jgi:uridine monophosphate synthetase